MLYNYLVETIIIHQITSVCLYLSIMLDILSYNVTVVIILELGGLAILSLSFKLTEGIVGIRYSAVNGIGNLNNSFLVIVLIRDGTTVGKSNLANELCSCSRLDQMLLFVLIGNRTGHIAELTGNKSSADLELVEHLTSKRIRFAMRGDRLFLVRILGIGNIKFDNGIIVGILIVNGMSGVIGEGNHLLGHLTFGIVVILYGIDDNLRGYDLSIEGNVAFCRADDSAFLILIIILLFARNVNRADDVSVAIVDKEKLRTS